MQNPKRMTVYLERDIHDALRSRLCILLMA